MKKVVVQILRTPAGGIRKHVYDILTGLPSEKFEHIFITNLNDADRPVPVASNIAVHHVDIGESPSPKDLLNLLKIFFLLYGRKVDAIHGHGAKGGLYARIIAFFLRAKCIYTPHGGSLHRVHGKLKNLIYDLIEVLLVPFTDFFLFESGYSQDIFFQNVLKIGDKAVVNYNGIELPATSARHKYVPGAKMRFASFGLLRKLKGHDIVVESCALLDKEGISFSYSIYGKGEELENLQALIRGHHLEGKVLLLNYTDDVPGEMLKYDFIIHPSRFESFGYVPLEAMALKIPVITSHEGGLKEVVDEQSGFISYTNTAHEYFKILSSLYKGENNFIPKVENAYQKILDNFTLKRMIKRIDEIYSHS